MQRSLVISSVLLAFGACSDQQTPRPAQRDSAPRADAIAPRPVGGPSTVVPAVAAGRTGRQVYDLFCAQCHGVTGDGEGTTELDRPARSFRDGGFSFGNTPEAIFRTVTNGIGGTPMPGFKTGLSDEERRLVAAYVVSLGPEPVAEAGAEANLTVWNRPLFARGQFNGIVNGAAEVPRGLLVGTIDGLSFQYRIDDVRLLGVRQGEFVRRSDWTGRGGTPLEPLGKLIHTVAGGSPPPVFAARGADGSPAALCGILRSTRVEGDRAWLTYDLVPDIVSGPGGVGRGVVATVRERGEAVSHENGSGFRRVFEIPASHEPVHLFDSGADAMPRSSTTEWVRSGAVISRTEILSGDAVLAMPIGALPACTIQHTVLILVDGSDATYENMIQELQR